MSRKHTRAKSFSRSPTEELRQGFERIDGSSSVVVGRGLIEHVRQTAGRASWSGSEAPFNIGPSSPMATRIAFRLMRAYGGLSLPRFERLLIRDRQAFRRSLERILAWPFERVIVTHGEVAEDARDEFIARYRWALGTR